MKIDNTKPSLKKNVVLSFLIQAIGYLSPLLVSPYISRVLGAENIGIYSFSYAYAHYFVLFISFGFANLGSKLISRERDNFERRNELFWSILSARLLFLFAGLFIYIFFIIFHLFPGIDDYKIMLVFCILIVSAGFDISFFFHGIEKLSCISIVTAIVNLLYILSIFLFVKNYDDLLVFTLLKTLNYSLIYIFLWFFAFRRVGKPKINKNDILVIIKDSFFYFIPTIFMSVSGSVTQTLIGVFSTKTQVGFYEQSSKITSLLASLISGISPVILSRISLLNKSDKQKNNLEISNILARSVNLSIVILVPLVAGLYIISSMFVPLFFGDEFIGAIPIFKWVLLVSIFSAIGSILISGYYYSYEKVNVVTLIMFIALVVNSGLTIILLKFTSLGALGAAIPSFITNLLAFIALYIGAFKHINNNLIIKDIWKVMIASIFMVVPLILLNTFVFCNLFSNNLITIVLDVIIGGVIYVVILLLLKESLLSDFLKSIFKKRE